MKKYKAVFLDLDDTLWACNENTMEAFEEVYNQFDLSRYFPSFIEFSAIYFPYNEQMWHLYNLGKIGKEELNIRRFSYPFNKVGINDEVFIKEFMETYFELIPTKSKLVTGAKELLDYLAPKYPLYILSNGFTEMQYIKMRSGGIEKYFSGVFLSDEIGVNKPDRKIFEYALSKAGFERDEVIMIGDNILTDIQGAANAGIDQVYFNPSKKELADFSPTYHINELFQIKDII